MTASRWVSDEVWAGLDPRVARLSRRDRWWLATATGLLAVTALLVALGRISGLLHTQVGWGYSDVRVDVRTHTALEHVELDNNGWFTERVDRITSPTPGVHVTAIAPVGLHIPAQGSTRATISLRFTCAVVRQGDVVLELHLHRAWGETTVQIWPFGIPHSDDMQSVNVFMDGPAWTACGRNR